MPIEITPQGLITIVLSILGTLGYVIRSNALNKSRLIQSDIKAKERETALYNDLARDAREAQLKLEKLQESIRAQLLEERNSTILEHHKLNDRLITAQENMLKLQNELRQTEQKEREAKARADILLNELTRNKESLDAIKQQLTNVQTQLNEANSKIGTLQNENAELKAEIGKIKKNATQPLVAVSPEPIT